MLTLRRTAIVLGLALLLPTATLAIERDREPAPAGPPIDFRAEPPFLMFSTVPPKPEEIRHYPIPDGSPEYWQLWEPDAPWRQAAEHVDLMAMHAWMIRQFARDAELRSMINFLKERDIPMGLEMEPLEWPGPEVCDHTESFEGPYDLEAARKVALLGGRLSVVLLDEPFSHAYKLQGPRNCKLALEDIVDEIGAYREKLREFHPGVQMGSIEPLWSDPRITADDMALWLDTFEERTGEPFAFLNIDVDWRIADWPERVREIEAVADERDVPFGVLYLGDPDSPNDLWLRQAAERFARYEVEHGGTPDIVGIYSWHEQPDRLLPDDEVTTQTGLINRYFGSHTQLDVGAPSEAAIVGRITDAAGSPLASEVLEVEVLPLGRSKQRGMISGTVPDGARQALIAVRANAEGGNTAPVDVRLSKMSYREKGRKKNLVPNGDLRKGMEGWWADGRGKASAKGGWMRLKAKPNQQLAIDGTRFKVTPGAPFEFSATLDVAERSFGSGYVSVIWLQDQEISRELLWFEPRSVPLASVTTAVDGTWQLPLVDLPRGRHEVQLRYAGDMEHWPAAATTLAER